MSRKRSVRSKSPTCAIIVFTLKAGLLLGILILCIPALSALSTDDSTPNSNSPITVDSKTPTRSFTVVTGPVPFGAQSQNRAGDIRKLLEDYVAYIATMEHFDPTSPLGSSSSASGGSPVSSLSSLSSASRSFGSDEQQSAVNSNHHRIDSQHSSESRDRFIFQAAPSPSDNQATRFVSTSQLYSSHEPIEIGTQRSTPTESALTLNLSDEELTTFIDNVLGASIQSEITPTTTITSSSASASSSAIVDVPTTQTETSITTEVPLITDPIANTNSTGKRFERAQLSDVTTSTNKNATSLPAAQPEVESTEKEKSETELSDKFYTHDYDYADGTTNATGTLTPEELFKLTEIDTAQNGTKHTIIPGSDSTGSNNYRTTLNSDDTELLRELRKAKQLLQAEMDRLRLTTPKPTSTYTTPTATPTTPNIKSDEDAATATTTPATLPNFTTLTPFSENDLGLEMTTIPASDSQDGREDVFTTVSSIAERQFTTTMKTPIRVTTTEASVPSTRTTTTMKTPTTTTISKASSFEREESKTFVASKNQLKSSEILNSDNDSNDSSNSGDNDEDENTPTELLVDTINGTAETTILTHVPKITIIHKIKKPVGVRSRSDEDAIYREALRKHRELIKNTMSSISLVPAAFKRYKIHADNNRVNSVGEIYLLPNFAQIQSQRSDPQILEPKQIPVEFHHDSIQNLQNFQRKQQFQQPQQQFHNMFGMNQQSRPFLRHHQPIAASTTEFQTSTVLKMDRATQRQALNDIDRQLIGALEHAMKSSPNVNSAESSLSSALLSSPKSMTSITPRLTNNVEQIGTSSRHRSNRNRFTYKRLLNKFNDHSAAIQRGVNNFNLINFEQAFNNGGDNSNHNMNNNNNANNNNNEVTMNVLNNIVLKNNDILNQHNNRVRQYVNFVNAFNIDGHPNPAQVIELFRPRSKNSAGKKFKRIKIVTNSTPKAIKLQNSDQQSPQTKRVVRIEKLSDKLLLNNDPDSFDSDRILTTPSPFESFTTTQAPFLVTVKPQATTTTTTTTTTSTTTPSTPIITTTAMPKPQKLENRKRNIKKETPKQIKITTTFVPVSKVGSGSLPNLNVSQVVENIVAHNNNHAQLLVKNTTNDASLKMKRLHGFKIFCGYDASAVWNNSAGVSFGIGQLENNPYLLTTCTHLIYSFASINMNGELEIPGTPEELARLRKLKQVYAPDLKIFVAVGGSETPAQLYSLLVATTKLRDRLAANIHKFILDHEMNGVVVAWFYPVYGSLAATKSNSTNGSNRSARSTPGQTLFQIDDRTNLVKFVKALRLRFDSIPIGQRLEIGLFAPPFDDAIDKGYDLERLNSFVDHQIVLTYDYFGPTSSKVHHFAPLFPDSDNKNNERGQRLSINHTINHWLDKKSQIRNKTLLSMAFYGRTFTLENSDNFTPGSKALGPGKPGPISSQPGLVFFNELCDLYLGHSNVRLIEDENKVTTYLKLFDQWVGFDDELALYRKTKFAINRGLSGVFVWDLGLDDFRNRCGWGRFPLLMAVRKAVEHCQAALQAGVQC